MSAEQCGDASSPQERKGDVQMTNNHQVGEAVQAELRELMES
jgi:hypothetical protein